MTTTNILCLVNGQNTVWFPDTGSEINLFGLNHYQDLCKQNPSTNKLKDTNKNIYAANNTRMPVKGVFTAILKSATATISAPIYVLKTSSNDPPLMGDPCLNKLNFVKMSKTGAFSRKVLAEDNQDDLTEDEFKQKLAEIHKTYNKVFCGIGKFKHFEAKLILKEGAEPFFIRAIPCPVHLKDNALARLKQFVDAGILKKVPIDEPITFCSPMLVIPKPNKPKEVRLVVNFKKLNSLLSRTQLMPGVRLEEFLQKMNGNKYFFYADMKDAYLQIPVDKESSKLLTISTFNGCYRFQRLALGLCMSQDIFDQVVWKTFANCDNTIVNRDDILGGSKTKRGLLTEYTKVLQCLNNSGLTIDPSKTKCGLTEIRFYGNIFTKDGMKPDPKKVEAVRTAPKPPNAKALTSFVAMVAWNSNFIHRFSELVAPLRQLANTKGTYIWTQEHDQCFEQLKKALCSETLNNYFVPGRETVIYTDAAKTGNASLESGGFSAILAQIDEHGNILVIHFASRSINTTESKWSQVELEARAIRYGLDKFRFYLQGLENFTVYTDCKPLISLFTRFPPATPPRIGRQILALQDLSFDLVFRPGKVNPSDFTSRSPVTDKSDLYDMQLSDELDTVLVRHIEARSDPLTLKEIREETKKDPDLQLLKQCIIYNQFEKHKKNPAIKPYLGMIGELSVLDDIIFRGECMVLPLTLRHLTVELIHNLQHSGETNTLKLLSQHFFFPSMTAQVQSHIALCNICLQVNRPTRKDPLGVSYTSSYPMETVSADFKGPIPVDGCYVLAFVCHFSLWPEVYFVTTTSFKATKKHFERFFTTYGYPQTLMTDSGPPFNSQEFAAFLKVKGIYHKRIIPDNPTSNSMVERFMGSIAKQIRIAEITKTSYKDLIMNMVMCKRATPNRRTNMSPHEVMRGHKMACGILEPKATASSRRGLNREEQLALQKKIIESKMENKQKYDSKRNIHQHILRPGDQAFVIMKEGQSPEKEIFTVTKVNGVDITAIDQHGRVIRRHSNRFIRIPNKQKPSEPKQPTNAIDTDIDIDQEDDEETDFIDQDDQSYFTTNNGQELNQQQQEQRQVHFNPTVQIRPTEQQRQRYGLRSRGTAPDLPLPRSALEHSAASRRRATNILERHQQQQQQQLRLDRPPEDQQQQD